MNHIKHHMNDNEKILLLLQLIRVNGNVHHLTWMGWTHYDILQKLDILFKKNVIDNNNNRISLTNKGKDYFNALSKSLKQKGLYKYFKPDYYSKTIALSNEDIYIPLRKK